MYTNINPEKVFRELADTLSYSSKLDFFDTLVTRLESILAVDHVFLAEVVNSGREAKTLSARSKGRFLSPISYLLRDTPCEQAGFDEPCFFNGDVNQLFPHDVLLQQTGAVSYMGMAIASPTGERMAVLSILQNSPMVWHEVGREVLRIVVAHIGAEMERRRNEARIIELAYQDKLTQLPNRAKLQDYLIEAVILSHTKQQALGLLILDLKRFKEINATYGHQVGDKLLIAVAGRLNNLFGTQLFVARHANDEYALVDTQSSPERLEQLAEQVQEVFQKPFKLAYSLFHVDVNLGAALLPHDSDTAAELFQHASIALDQAKKNNSAQCIYDSAMAEKVYRQQRMLHRLTQAIEQGRLDVYFQPQFCVKTEQLCGAEALCRWQDDELGVVSPAEFIPLAEERGLILELDTFVLKRVAQQLAQWHQNKTPLPGRVSVNLSAQQFERADLVESLLALIEQEQVSSQAFTLELTESVMMRHPEEALRTTRFLRESGFDIAVDDFGTGYSSLAYLQRLAIQQVKIDRSFVFGIEKNKQNRSIVAAIIAMAHSLNMQTVAEGIETEGQKELLTSLGCNVLQGFYLGRPEPAAVFESLWLKQVS